MASRKLTFTFPQDLAAEFLRRVPASGRSEYVAKAIADKLRERDAQLARVCEVANNSMDVHDIESSFEALVDESDIVQEEILEARRGEV
jgi:metal-responsive CopG/Arc/MetJ family transcriptional regulator